MEPEKIFFSSGGVRRESSPAEEPSGEGVQAYLNEAKRVAGQRDSLAFLKYESAAYRERLREVERDEQALVRRRLSLLEDYPHRPEVQRLTAWERRQELIANEHRFFAVSVGLSGLIMLFAGVSGLLYCSVHTRDALGDPLLLLGLAIFGSLLSAATSKYIPLIARSLRIGKVIRRRTPPRRCK
jgi:hypothetical protein